jgi:hypothetical protein
MCYTFAYQSGGLRLLTTASSIRVANLEDLHGDGPHALSAGGFDVVVVRTPAGLRAFEGRCPHQGALLGEGELDGDKLERDDFGQNRFGIPESAPF